MCGRMTLTRSAQEIAAYFALETSAVAVVLASAPDGRGERARFNVAPTQSVLTAVAREPGVLALGWRRWGLIPSWARDPAIGAKLFNARSETVDEKPSFRAAFRRRRCLVVADGFYEWTPRNRGHRPHWFASPTAPLLVFAGLHERGTDEAGQPVDSCTVLTTEANPDLAPIHPRMPVVLARETWDEWLDPSAAGPTLKALLAPAPPGTLVARAVGRYVNDARHDDVRCLVAETAEEESGADDGRARARGVRPEHARSADDF